jgi:hypothetical protein
MRAVAYVSHGWWVADCPRPYCASAEHFGNRDGYVGGLTAKGFRCADCRLQCGVEWPPNVDDIGYLLGQRPVSATRNWRPGETVHDLLQENALHGITPPPMQIAGGRIQDRQLVASAHRMIGGR